MDRYRLRLFGTPRLAGVFGLEKEKGRNHDFLSDSGTLWTILDFLLVRRGDPITRFNQLKSKIKYNRRLVNTVLNTVGKFLWLAY